MTKEKIEQDIDFIKAKKFNNSIKELRRNHDKPIPDKVIASFLGLTVEEVQSIYKQIVKKIQDKLQINS